MILKSWLVLILFISPPLFPVLSQPICSPFCKLTYLPSKICYHCFPALTEKHPVACQAPHLRECPSLFSFLHDTVHTLSSHPDKFFISSSLYFPSNHKLFTYAFCSSLFFFSLPSNVISSLVPKYHFADDLQKLPKNLRKQSSCVALNHVLISPFLYGLTWECQYLHDLKNNNVLNCKHKLSLIFQKVIWQL